MRVIATLFGLCAGSTVAGDIATGYVDEASCYECHRDRVHSDARSPHALTSALPTRDSIKGNFKPGLNTMLTTDPAISFVMDETAAGFFETALVRTPETILKRRERMDLVIGSGRKGQTYLYWKGDRLYELPVSVWTATGEWMNSPGFPDGSANFDRGVSERCLECHTTSFEWLSPPRNRVNPESLVLGISCQKCHGPGGDHVTRARAGSLPGGTALVNLAKLPRERQMDLCSLCHAGVGEAYADPLTYTAGDVLEKYLSVSTTTTAEVRLDVHGSQVPSLIRSRCYQSSATMTCTTCHDVHVAQRQPEQFAAKCLTCHQTENCGKFAALGRAIESQCVDCHMPLQTTGKIVMRINGQKMQPKIRNHTIGIYPDVPLPEIPR